MSKNTQENTHDGRLSARVVEEGYIRLQETMQKYRAARDQGNAAAGLAHDADPVIVLQNEVQTFFSLIRPYVKDKPQLEEYWWGALATYPAQPHRTVPAAFDYYREHSIGVWQSQRHTRVVPRQLLVQQTHSGANPAVADGGGPESLDDWHDLLNLSSNIRVVGIEPASEQEDDFEGYYCTEGRFAVLGLREIQHWSVKTHHERVNGGGFMSGETTVEETREPEPAKKVETAANMLVEVAEELSAIATYEPRGERVHGTPVPDS